MGGFGCSIHCIVSRTSPIRGLWSKDNSTYYWKFYKSFFVLHLLNMFEFKFWNLLNSNFETFKLWIKPFECKKTLKPFQFIFWNLLLETFWIQVLRTCMWVCSSVVRRVGELMLVLLITLREFLSPRTQLRCKIFSPSFIISVS